MLGSNPGQLRLRHWLSDALTTLLDLIHTLLDLIHILLDFIHNSARSHPQSARSHPLWVKQIYPTHPSCRVGGGGASWRRQQRNMDLFTILTLYDPYERLISPTPLSPVGGDTPALLHENAPSPIDMTSCLSNIFHWDFGGFFAEVKKYVRDMSAARLTGWWRKRMGGKKTTFKVVFA
jgi:hypothetical protein